MINSKVEAAINNQINAEFWSAYFYLSMSNYFSSIGLAGFANWMNVQFEEEVFHARRFMTYLNERGGRVILKPIDEVQTSWEGPLNVFEETLSHEEKVTGLINELMDIAIKESDHATKSFLQWFIDEQVEEEAGVSEILDHLRLINGEGQGLFLMDKELKTRVFTPPVV
ncbi:MAG: ferritin [Bacteroidales bacterium]|nr:ferritin [Bacteroidales bacterium]